MLSSLPRARARQGRSRTGEMNLRRDQHLFLLVPSRAVARRAAFRAGLSPVGLLAEPRLVLRNVGPVCRNTGLFTCRGLATCSRSGRRTAVSGLGNAAGVCWRGSLGGGPLAAGRVCQIHGRGDRVGVPVPQNFAGARGLADHSLRRRGQSALMRPEPLFGTTEPRKLCVQGSNGFGRGLGVHRMRQRCRLRR
jgi:hypothetical protein